RYEGRIDPTMAFGRCAEGSLDEFLIERYTAYTSLRSVRRFFRIWHEPWLQAPVEVNVLDESLLAETWRWVHVAKPAGANYSPGLKNVWMGGPHWAGRHVGEPG